MLLNFFQERQTPLKMMRDFAPVCDKLAELARKNAWRDRAHGRRFHEVDWRIQGQRWRGFRFHSGATADALTDDFPISWDRIESDPAQKLNLYAYGPLGRPASPLRHFAQRRGRLRLYRGAVMTYRSFARTNAEPLDEASWRVLAGAGDVPPPPDFTKSFYATRDAAELIKEFTALSADVQGSRWTNFASPRRTSVTGD